MDDMMSVQTIHWIACRIGGAISPTRPLGFGCSMFVALHLTFGFALPASARDIARACTQGHDGSAALLRKRLREATGVAECVRATPPITFSLDKAGDGFRIVETPTGTHVSASRVRGLNHAVGWLLRHAVMTPGKAEVAIPAKLDERPAVSIRMTQIGYRAKNNSFDGWTTAMFDRRIEDMALWGASGVQVIAPVSDDAPTSPLFPQSPIATLQAIGRAARRLDLDFALYYPMMGDYLDSVAIRRESAAVDKLLKQLPTVDAFFVPGGDPGHTAPDRLFPLVERVAETVRRHNPETSVWLSTQGFDAAGFESFYKQLERQPDWLTGIFAGPQTRDPVPLQRRRIPSRYRLLLYPDVSHTMHAQFPVPQWYPEFALTEGREPINPQPQAQSAIARYFAPFHSGFITYSEGTSDDFNTMMWYQLGWNPNANPSEIVRGYERLFIGDPRAVGLIHDLERSWAGDPATNVGIDATLRVADRILPGSHADWRVDSLRYRAVYDAIVRHRTIAARRRQSRALAALAKSGEPAKRVAAARRELARPDGPAIDRLQTQLVSLAQRLFDKARLQLSVERFCASHVERGANLDRAKVDLNDRVWLERGMSDALSLHTIAERDRALRRLTDVRRAREGALYDDLGNPAAEPHLVRGLGFDRDPQMFATAVDGVADRTPEDGWRMAQLSYAEMLYDRPLRLRYNGLDPKRRYRVAITYAGEDYALPIRLVADGSFEIHAPRKRRQNPDLVEFDIPAAATSDGILLLEWSRPVGEGGSGRGAQIAEIWLISTG